MTWIGLAARDETPRFDPLGLAGTTSYDGVRTGQRVVSEPPAHPLAKGTFLTEFEIEPSPRRQNLIRYSARDPQQSSLTLCVDPDNSLALLTSQGSHSFAARLTLPLDQARQRVVVSYVWDQTSQHCALAAWMPDLGKTIVSEHSSPTPITLRDAERILTRPDHCLTAPEIVFVAISTAREPVGPPATFGQGTLFATPKGQMRIEDLCVGDFVVARDGGPVQVRWQGYQDLPAKGSFRPHLVRSPYHGLQANVVTTPDQKIRLSGSAIDYAFGQEAVFAAVRDMKDGQSVLQPDCPDIMRYWQILPDRHAILAVTGAEMESMESAQFLSDPGLRRHSVLRALPPELLPRGRKLGMPTIKSYEVARIAV